MGSCGRSLEAMRFCGRARQWCAALLLACAIACHGGSARAAEDPRDDVDWQKAGKASSPEAQVILKALAEKYPKSGWPPFELGERLYEAKDYEGALDAYEAAGARGFDLPSIRGRKAKTLAKLKRYADAEAQYRAALEADPAAVAARFGLGSALYSQGKSAEALPYFEALAQREDDWGAYAREFLAACLYDTGKFERAVLLLQDLLKKNAADHASRWMLAKSLFKLKRYPEALEACRQVSAADATRLEAARYYEGACLEALGRLGDAEKVYASLGKGGSEWAQEARKSGQSLVGRPVRAYLDYTGGYDTGIIQSGDDNVVSGGKDFYSQVYAMVEGRVLRREKFQLWLGAEHFGIHYAELTDNDYFQDAATATVVVPRVGPFAELKLKYRLMYAQLDYQPYERQHAVDLSALFRKDANRLRIGAEYDENRFFRESGTLSGPVGRVYADYKRQLAMWDHELRLRANVDFRWSDARASERLTQRVRLMYYSQVCGRLYASVEGTWRRDDFLHSRSLFVPKRIDHKLSGEARFEYQIWKHATINLGYLYESQDSTRVDQEYGRHQVDAGFSLSF